VSAKYTVGGPNIVRLVFDDGEFRPAAWCAKPADAAELLNRARVANDIKRQYTAAARLIARAESLPGFKWIVEGA
jgi:hypothetical protein